MDLQKASHLGVAPGLGLGQRAEQIESAASGFSALPSFSCSEGQTAAAPVSPWAVGWKRLVEDHGPTSPQKRPSP